jgi:hypothetical protein
MRHLMLPVLVACILGALGPAGHTATCQVPSSGHPTIQSAVDDASCTEIVLAAQTFSESPLIDRDLTLDGAGSSETFIEGSVEVSAGTVIVQELQISAPPGTASEALWAHSGASLSGFDVMVFNGRWVPLFADGFESGTTSAWSYTSP